MCRSRFTGRVLRVPAVPIALPLLTVVLAVPVCGPLDLEGAIAVATANADEVSIQRAEVLAAESDLAIAQAARILPSASATLVTGPVPEARGNILESRQTNRSLTGLGPFVRIDADVVQPIYTWGRLDAARDAAKAGVEARKSQLTGKIAELQVRVAQLFWGEAVARRLLAIASDVEKNLNDVSRKLEELLKKDDPSVKPADRFRLEMYRALLRTREADGRKALETAHSGLAATLGLGADQVTLQEVGLPLDPGEVPDLAAARDRAERQRPDLRALDQALAAREAEVHAAEAAMLPQVFVGGTFSYAYAPNRDVQLNPWIDDTFNHLGVGVALGIKQDLAFPLLLSQAAKARAQRETLRRQRAGLARLVTVQVEAAVADVVAAREHLAASTSALAAGRSWFRSEMLNFGVGVTEPRDVLEGYGAYVQSQVDQQQAAYDLAVARVRLLQVTGVTPRQPAHDPCALSAR